MSASLAQALERAGVVGRIITPIHDVYRKARMLSSGDPDATFGLGHLLPAGLEEIVGAVATLAGNPFPPDGRAGNERSWIEPAMIAGQAEAAAGRLRQACRRGERVLFGTGHPTGPLELYIRLAAEMRARGAEVVAFAEAESFPYEWHHGRAQVRYVCDVACLSAGGDLLHTHSPRPMEYLLDTGPKPDLVVGDHGFAGVALARGADAVALVDTNDPALALAWARGLRLWPVLCDDNRPPTSYRPLGDFIVGLL